MDEEVGKETRVIGIPHPQARFKTGTEQGSSNFFVEENRYRFILTVK